MKATQALPPGYVARGAISLEGNRRLLVLLNLLGIPWLVLCAIFFVAVASKLQPAQSQASGTLSLSITSVLLLLVIAVTIVGVLVIHELVHGLFFWLFTRSRPRFGFKGAYAYAAAPDWYIPRPQMLVVGLTPLILLSLLGLPFLALVPYPASLFLVLALSMNAAGAIGDLYIAARLLFTPRDVLIQDEGETIRWYVPESRR